MKFGGIMKTLYLHIGTPKTGTTSIQSWIFKNQKALNKRSFYVPKSFQRYDKIGIRRNAHFLVGHLGSSSVPFTKKENAIMYDGLEYVVNFFEQYDNIILSDENIWWSSSYDRTNLWDILLENAKQNNYIIKIIVYLRRQDQFLISRYNQLVKVGRTSEKFNEYVINVQTTRSDLLDYGKRIDGLSALFGKENVIVRRFARDAFYQGDLIADFLQTMGLTYDSDFVAPAEESNVSLPANLTELKRMTNSLDNITGDEKWYFRNLMFAFRKQCDYEYPCGLFSPDEARAFLEQYREENERVAAEYIGDGKPLFHYTVEELPKYSPDNPYITEDLNRFFCTAVLSLHQKNEALDKRLDEGSNMQNLLPRLLRYPVSAFKDIFSGINEKNREE